MELFNSNLPISVLKKEFPDIPKRDKKKFDLDLKNKYFSFYEKLSGEFREKTNIYTSIYHMCLNTMIIAFFLLIVFVLLTISFFPNNDIFIVPSLTGIILMLRISIEVLFKNKIIPMFRRALKMFKESEDEEYQALEKIYKLFISK